MARKEIEEKEIVVKSVIAAAASWTTFNDTVNQIFKEYILFWFANFISFINIADKVAIKIATHFNQI